MASASEISDSEPASPEIEEMYKGIIIANGIEDEVSEVLVKDAGLKGEGFTSLSQVVTVKFQDSSMKPISLFVKSMTTNESFAKFLDESKLYDKEAEFFARYVPAVKGFCEEKGSGALLDIYPKCYYGDSKTIVLENLIVDKGFELLDKAKQQDLETATLALTTLAQHHAISYSYMKSLGGETSFLDMFPALAHDSNDNDSIREMMAPSMESGLNINIDVVKRSNVAQKEECIEFLSEKLGKAWDYIIGLFKLNLDDPVHVLNHGDYWNNNMMFHRNPDTGDLDGHKAIDFQCTRYDSPAIDLGYFLYSSVRPEVRRANLKQLLTHYLRVFNETCERLDCPVTLTYEQLFQAYLRKFHFGFWHCGIMLMFGMKGYHEVMKQVDITTVDFNEFDGIFNGLLHKWMEDNPEAHKEDAEGVVQLMMEYKGLTEQ